MFRPPCPTTASVSLGLLLVFQAALSASGIAPQYGEPTLAPPQGEQIRAPLPGESVALRTAVGQSETVNETTTATETELAPDAAYAGTEGETCSGPTSCFSGNQRSSLFGNRCASQKNRFKVGGWLEQGITFNAGVPADRFNGPIATNDRDAEYQMNQFWLYLDRPIDTGGCGFDIGGHVDLLYGSDFRFGINHGLEDNINSVDDPYGLVIPQAYIEVGVNNLSVKLGHFAGILDYEAVPSVANPFYSHSYSYSYTVPQLVTGVLADYKLTDRLSVAGGFHRGWMMFDDMNHNLDFMGGIKWNSCDDRTKINFGLSTGAQDPAGQQERFVYSLVVKRQVTKKFQYVLVHNLGFENDAVISRHQVRQDAEWYGINQYFLYQINPCWTAGLRFEWLRDDDGARVFGVPNAIPLVRTWPGGPGFAGDFYELTAGLNWRPHSNVVVRPEVRWDWYNGTVDANNKMPFDAGNREDQFTFATDLIVTF